jgi:hypothetical protein
VTFTYSTLNMNKFVSVFFAPPSLDTVISPTTPDTWQQQHIYIRVFGHDSSAIVVSKLFFEESICKPESGSSNLRQVSHFDRVTFLCRAGQFCAWLCPFNCRYLNFLYVCLKYPNSCFSIVQFSPNE